MVRSHPARPEIFVCEECGLGYADRGTAEACEAYCRSHQSCSIEITAKAVYPASGDEAAREA